MENKVMMKRRHKAGNEEKKLKREKGENKDERDSKTKKYKRKQS